jgi:predicted nucleic acid-binding protein
MIIVSDTSPISNLAAIGQLELLQQLYGNVVIPTAVYQEILNSGDTDPAVLAIKSVNWIQTLNIKNTALFQTLQSNLDIGEAEAITLAVELNADRLIVDERRGRKEAIRLGLRVTGILGILLAAKQQGLVLRIQPLLDDLIANGFWIREELYAELLQLAGE